MIGPGLRRHRHQLRLRRFKRDSRFETAEDVEPASLERVGTELELYRRPDVHRPAGELEIPWQHADHRAAASIEHHRPAKYRLVATEPALPESVAQHDHPFRAGPILVDTERAANGGLHPEQVEQIRGDHFRGDPFGFSATGEIERPV